jgi:hypothetical protein
MRGREIGNSELICRVRIAVLDADRHVDNLGTFASAANDSAARSEATFAFGTFPVN